MTTLENPYAFEYSCFSMQAQNHQLSIVRNDGLYRHLRVHKPGTRIWSWDVIT